MQPLNELQCYWRTSRIVQIKNVERAEQEANCCQRIFDVVYNNDAIDCQHKGISRKSRRPYTFKKKKMYSPVSQKKMDASILTQSTYIFEIIFFKHIVNNSAAFCLGV